ncbi:NUDIX domain-containing protein [Candidatus Roizmanbacteria bacterium]|nr:NUDIX domain-containing protein [Candidatus Roizmanbacteria bacterium]
MSVSTEGRFMVAVGAVIEHAKTGRILLIKRSEKADFSGGIWEEVIGRMKQFEEPEEALKREALEEAGVSIDVIKPISNFHIFRGEKTAEQEVIGIIYWAKTESDTVTLSEEHTDYQWLTPEDALHLASHPGIKRDIEAYIREKGTTNKNIVTWEKLNEEIDILSKRVESTPDIIIGIVRGGMIPARMLASKLKVKQMFCLSVTKMGNERKVTTEISEDISGKTILLVEDMLETGKSLIVVKKYLEQKGALVKTACLYTMSISQIQPDYSLRAVSEVPHFPWE